MKLKILIASFLYIVSVQFAVAQYTSATLGIDGLTCSMCSNSVEKLMRQLDFVADVDMDLNTTTAIVTFHPDKKVRINDLAKKVFDAGFSVRSLQALMVLNNAEAKEGSSFIYEGDEYIFVKSSSDQKINGETNLTFIGKTYMSKKEFTHWANIVAKNKGKEKSKSKAKSQVYHIIL